MVREREGDEGDEVLGLGFRSTSRDRGPEESLSLQFGRG
jgi:hypothetical protein